MVEAEFVLQLKDILRDSPVKIYSESLPLLNMGGGLGHEFYPICVSYIAHEKIYQQWNKYLLFRLLYVISSFKIIWYIYIYIYIFFFFIFGLSKIKLIEVVKRDINIKSLVKSMTSDRI